MLTIALLGGGTMGTTHALSYENIPGGFRVAAVSDAREEHADARIVAAAEVVDPIRWTLGGPSC